MSGASSAQPSEHVTGMFSFSNVNFFSATPLRLEAHRLLHSIIGHPQLEFAAVDMRLHDRAVELHQERADKAWSLTDCVSFVLMRDRDVTRALTHDHHFEQAGFEALLRAEPP